MIKQLESGAWYVEGTVIHLESGDKKFGLGEGAVYIPAKEMGDFIHAEAQKLADRALAILIEHQRKALLPEPEQREGE